MINESILQASCFEKILFLEIKIINYYYSLSYLEENKLSQI